VVFPESLGEDLYAFFIEYNHFGCWRVREEKGGSKPKSAPIC
jgi:hypothetical protein